MEPANAVQRFIAYLQGLLGPINLLPSWINEALVAIFAIPILYFFLGIAGFVVFEIASAIYEWWPFPKIDPHGYDPADVGQRTVGAVGALLVILGGHFIGIGSGWFILLGSGAVVVAWFYGRRYNPGM